MAEDLEARRYDELVDDTGAEPADSPRAGADDTASEQVADNTVDKAQAKLAAGEKGNGSTVPEPRTAAAAGGVAVEAEVKDEIDEDNGDVGDSADAASTEGHAKPDEKLIAQEQEPQTVSPKPTVADEVAPQPAAADVNGQAAAAEVTASAASDGDSAGIAAKPRLADTPADGPGIVAKSDIEVLGLDGSPEAAAANGTTPAPAQGTPPALDQGHSFDLIGDVDPTGPATDIGPAQDPAIGETLTVEEIIGSGQAASAEEGVDADPLAKKAEADSAEPATGREIDIVRPSEANDTRTYDDIPPFERVTDQETAKAQFDRLINVAGGLTGSAGYSEIKLDRDEVDIKKGTNRTLHVSASKARDPEIHPGIIHVSMLTEYTEGKSKTITNEFVRILDGPEGVSVLTSDMIIDRQEKTEGPFLMPEPTQDPEALQLAYAKVSEVMWNFRGDAERAKSAPEWPVTEAAPEDVFNELREELATLSPEGEDIFVQPKRIGLDPEHYTVRLSMNHLPAKGDRFPVTSITAVTMDVKQNGFDEAEEVLEYRFQQVGDNLVELPDDEEQTALAGINGMIHGEDPAEVSAFVQHSKAELFYGALGFEDLVLREANIQAEAEVLAEVADVLEGLTPVGGPDEAGEQPESGSNALEIYLDRLPENADSITVDDAADTIRVIDLHPVTADTAEDADSAEADEHTIRVEDLHENAADYNDLRNALPEGAPPEHVSIFKLTGRYMRETWDALKENCDVITEKLDNRIMRKLTLLENQFYRVELIERQAHGLDGPSDYYLRTLDARHSTVLMDRADYRRRMRAEAGAIGLSTFKRAYDSLADARQARQAARFERTEYQFHKGLVITRLAQDLPRARTAEERDEIRNAIYRLSGRRIREPGESGAFVRGAKATAKGAGAAARGIRTFIDFLTDVSSKDNRHTIRQAMRRGSHRHPGKGFRMASPGNRRRGGWDVYSGVHNARTARRGTAAANTRPRPGRYQHTGPSNSRSFDSPGTAPGTESANEEASV